MKMNPEPDSNLILGMTEDGRMHPQVLLEGGMVWLPLDQRTDLF